MVIHMGNNRKKPAYKEGTVNGVKTSENRRLTRKERQELEYKSLVKMLTSCVCILIMVFVLNWIITSSFTFNGINYEEPKGNEVVEVIGSTSEDIPSERVNLHLNGKLTIKLEVGDKYVEPGYIATSDLNGDISEHVIVAGMVDTSTIGTYELTYTLSYRGIKPKLTRLVKVVEKKKTDKDDTNKKPSSSEKPSNGGNSSSNPSTGGGNSSSGNGGSNNTGGSNNNPGGGGNSGGNNSGSQPTTPVKPQGNITLKLNGNATVYITEGSSYTDAGATATDNNGNNVSSKIVKSGSVNPSVAGTYKITYSITNYNGEVLTVIRNVIVQAMGIHLSLDNSNPTNKSVNILVTTNVDNFDRLMLPNGTKVPNKNYTYKVTTNGTYEFVVFNTAGASRKGTIVVSNIDKDKPKGKCVITQDSEKTYITITANDVSGIAKYIYSGNDYSENVITIDNKLATGIQINVGFYDRAGNFGNANCLVP